MFYLVNCVSNSSHPAHWAHFILHAPLYLRSVSSLWSKRVVSLWKMSLLSISHSLFFKLFITAAMLLICGQIWAHAAEVPQGGVRAQKKSCTRVQLCAILIGWLFFKENSSALPVLIGLKKKRGKPSMCLTDANETGFC